MASNSAVIELCPNDSYWHATLKTDDVLLRVTDSNQVLNFATTSNTAPALSISGSNVAVNGGLSVNGLSTDTSNLVSLNLITSLTQRRYYTPTSTLQMTYPCLNTLVDPLTSSSTAIASTFHVYGDAGYDFMQLGTQNYGQFSYSNNTSKWNSLASFSNALGFNTFSFAGSQAVAIAGYCNVSASNYSLFSTGMGGNASNTLYMGSNMWVTGPCVLSNLFTNATALTSNYAIIMRENTTATYGNLTCMYTSPAGVTCNCLLGNYSVPADGKRYYVGLITVSGYTAQQAFYSGNVFYNRTSTISMSVGSNVAALGTVAALAMAQVLTVNYPIYTWSNEAYADVHMASNYVAPQPVQRLNVVGLASVLAAYSNGSNAINASATNDGGSNWVNVPWNPQGFTDTTSNQFMVGTVTSFPAVGSNVNVSIKLGRSNVTLAGVGIGWS